MLGVPATLMDLLSSDVLTKSEPASDDHSTISPSHEPARSHVLNLFNEFRLESRLPVLLTLIFHPPST